MNPKNIYKEFLSKDPNSKPESRTMEEAIGRDINKVNRALWPLLAVALLAAFIKGLEMKAASAVMLWTVACFAAGGTLGFLFGIPKSATGEAPKTASTDDDGHAAPDGRSANARGRANTNLEEVSDWLTKIVVGLTLVHLNEIRSNVVDLGIVMAATFHEVPSAMDRSFAMALIVGFFVVGFLHGYLYTRMFLQGAFARSDPGQSEFKAVMYRELKLGSRIPTPENQPLPSVEQIRSAKRVQLVVPAGDPKAALKPLQEIAAEYEAVRASLPSGTERYQKLREIVDRMTTIALAAAACLPEFIGGATSGERLVAAIILKLKFDPAHIEWLAARMVDEPPFVAYHAAGALLGGTRIVGHDDQVRIYKAVSEAQAALAKRGRPDPSRDQLIAQILQEGANAGVGPAAGGGSV